MFRLAKIISVILLHAVTCQAASNKQHAVAVYWGQNGGHVIENNNLAAYCTPDSDINIIILAFLYQFGNGTDIASGVIGQSCSITTSGEGQQCEDLAAAIETCQATGIKVMLSLGGAVGDYTVQSRDEAERIGQNLWEAYGNLNGKSPTVPRPFGDTFINGWDMNIENGGGSENYQYLVAKLRSNFALDPANQYYISGAPQCPIPDANMNTMISNSQFDYLWVQFYNNPACSVNGAINFDDWKTNLANHASASAKIFIGIPASPVAANGMDSGSKYYLQPDQLADLVEEYSSDPVFGGIMMWSAGFSDENLNDGCTYAQEAKSILSTGCPC